MLAEPAQDGHVAAVQPFSTDMLGFFRVHPDRPVTGSVQLIVFAVGRPLTLFRLRPSKEGLTLSIPQTGGGWRIDFGGTPDTITALPLDFNLYAIANDQGAIVPLRSLVSLHAATVVPQAQVTTVAIPSLAPGHWRLLKFSSLRAAVTATAASNLPVLRERDVYPGRVAHDSLK